MTRILVTGANGQLGSEIRELEQEFPAYAFVFTDIDTLDLTNFTRLDKFLQEIQPDVILNCAAYTAVDKAEHETEQASVLNVDVPEFLAKYAHRAMALLIHISTDYVFDGRDYQPYKESHPPDPTSFYGKTKLDGENAIMLNANRSVIIRTSWLYSFHGHNFVKTMLHLADNKPEARVVCDQVGCPTYAKDLALAILTLIPEFNKVQSHEIFHYANEGACSWYDFAVAIMQIAEKQCPVIPIQTSEYPTLATRPHFSLLNKSKIKGLGISIPYWRDSLSHCINRILQNKS